MLSFDFVHFFLDHGSALHQWAPLIIAAVIWEDWWAKGRFTKHRRERYRAWVSIKIASITFTYLLLLTSGLWRSWFWCTLLLASLPAQYLECRQCYLVIDGDGEP